jgi:hypothetical protein
MGVHMSPQHKEQNMTDRLGSAHDVPAGLRPPPRPRWVIWLVIAIAVAVLVFLGSHLLMGGHGPMRHMPGMNHGLPATAIQDGPARDAT